MLVFMLQKAPIKKPEYSMWVMPSKLFLAPKVLL